MVGVEEEYWEYFIPKCATLARGLFSVQGNQAAPDVRKPFTSLLKEFRVCPRKRATTRDNI